MSDSLPDELLLRLRARLQAAAKSTVSLPRARLTSEFWFALHQQPVPRTAPRCVVVPLDVFMTLRNTYPNSFPSAQVPLTQDPLSPLALLYPSSGTPATTAAAAAATTDKTEFYDVTFDELDLDPAEANSLAAIRAAMHAAHSLDVAASTLSVAAKKLWDPPAMWDVLPWTGAADACCVDDSCVFRLVDRAPPREPDAAELAAARQQRRPVQQFPTLDDILREDEWAAVVRRCESIEQGPGLPVPHPGCCCTTRAKGDNDDSRNEEGATVSETKEDVDVQVHQ